MRSRLDKLMAVGGLLLILMLTFVLVSDPLALAAMLLGIIMAFGGLWGLGSRIQPDRRVYLKLRAEVDQFIDLVRRINAHVVAGDGAGASEAKAAMHESVEQIAQAAGVVGVMK